MRSAASGRTFTARWPRSSGSEVTRPNPAAPRRRRHEHRPHRWCRTSPVAHRPHAPRRPRALRHRIGAKLRRGPVWVGSTPRPPPGRSCSGTTPGLEPGAMVGPDGAVLPIGGQHAGVVQRGHSDRAHCVASCSSTPLAYDRNLVADRPAVGNLLSRRISVATAARTCPIGVRTDIEAAEAGPWHITQLRCETTVRLVVRGPRALRQALRRRRSPWPTWVFRGCACRPTSLPSGNQLRTQPVSAGERPFLAAHPQRAGRDSNPQPFDP